jgi:hypothetical protein
MKIVTTLIGGLGNQLFIASCGLALANRLGAKLYLDKQRLANKKPEMAAALEPYAHGAETWPHLPELRHRLAHRAKSVAVGIFRKSAIRSLPGWKGARFVESGYYYDPKIENVNGDIYLVGYFQSPRYFANYEDEIRKTFAPQQAASDKAMAHAKLLAGDDTVSLHLRRGDYASNPKAFTVHGILTDDYYDYAVGLIRRVVANPRIFIFSDSPAEAARMKERWSGAETVNGFNDKDDLFLMSQCRHHIIANSSFSWWGAWLDGRPDGIVAAPRAWFSKDKMLTTYVNDLFPPDWVTLG